MATVVIGIQVDLDNGVAFFGLEEVNRRIARGARVLELRPGSAVLNTVEHERGHSQMTVRGCQIYVVLED